MNDRIRKIFYIIMVSFFLTACSSGSDAIDKFFGGAVPSLNILSSKTIAQTDLFKIDVNNIKDGLPGNDDGMTYQCFFDRTVDGIVAPTKPCSTLPDSSVNFNSTTGVLEWTPDQNNANLGQYEVKISGTNGSGETSQIFDVGVRLKFTGVTLIQNITGTSADLSWIPNPNAVAYQIYKANSFTGLYELHSTIAGGANSGGTMSNLLPSTAYSIRVQAVDSLGFPDGNVVTSSFITTQLVKLSMAASTTNAVAGTPVTLTINAFNSDDSPQTVGGLALSSSVVSGTSSGNFSTIVDNHNGSYTYTFTPTTVGTAATIEVSTTTTTFYLMNSITLNVSPGPANSTNSSLASTSNTVVSGNSVTLTAQIRDQYNNPISSGATIAFQGTGGTSTGTFGTVNNMGNGVYTATFTGVLAGTTKTLSVTVNGTPLTMTTPITVTPGIASSITTTLAVSTSSLPSGTDSTVTATLRDANGNRIPSGVLVSFNKSGGTSTGTFGSVVNQGNGVYTTTYTGILAGSAQTISVSVDSLLLTPTATIAVIPGAPSVSNSSTTISSATVVSGSYSTVTATIKDLNNNPIETGITVTFAKSGGTSTGTFGTVSNQGAGQYNVRYNGVTAGTAQNIQVQINGVNFGSTVAVSVVNSVASALNSSLVTTAASIVSGNTATITATLRDSNNNLISSGYAVTFAKTGGTSTGNFGATVNNGDGTYTVTYTGILAGSAQNISVLVDGASLLSITETVTTGPAHLANSSVTISNPTVISGAFVTATATIKDLNNNPLDTAITVSFVKSGGTSTGTFGSVVNQGNGVYTIRYTGVTAGTAQSIQLQINGVNFAAPVSIAVTNGSPSATTSTLATSSPTVVSGSSVTITATLRDDNNNLITSGYAVSFAKGGGTSTGTFGSVVNNGDGTYSVTYTGVTAGSAQTISLLVDSIALGSNTITETVTVGGPSSMLSTLTVSSNTIVAGTSSTLTATIKDANGNPISTGILVMFDKIGGTSTGTLSVVTNQGNGVYTATYTGNTAGAAQTVQATVNGAPFGPTQSIQVIVGSPNLAHSSLTLSANTVKSSSAITLTAVIRDSQNNPITNQFIISFDAVGGSSTGNISAVNNLGGGTFTATYTGVNAGSAQTIRVFADGSQISGLTGPVTVTPGAVLAANSTFTIANGASAVIQSTTAVNLAMNLRDANSNAISDAGTVVTFVKTAGVSNGNISAVSNLTNGNYSATYTGSATGPTQTINLVVDGVNTGMSVTATVTAGPPTHIEMTGAPVGILNSIDCNGPYTATLRDANNNTTVSTNPVTVSLSSAPALSHVGTIFTDSGCTASANSLSIPASTSTFSFYYKSYRPQGIVLTLAPNLSIASTTQNITNIPVLSWMGAGAYFTMNGSGSQTAYDDSSGGSYSPQDVLAYGNYLYVADITTHRIIKYDTTTNTMVGWIGHVGSVEGMTAYDGTTACDNLNPTTASLTPKWCLGGRANIYTAPLLNAPRNLATDGVYLYVASGHRILRFLLTDGSHQGWYGRIATITGMTDDGVSGTVCSSAGAAATTPKWCYGGTTGAGTTNGQFNTITGLLVYGNYLYVSDYNNHRIQRIDISGSNPAFSGWIGNIGTTASMTPASCVTAGPGASTPTWCYGGTAQAANRYNLPSPGIPPVEQTAPNEGYYLPRGLTTDGTYLYIADGNNYRIVRNFIGSGLFDGWIGYARASTAINPHNGSATYYASARYTTSWTSGGVVGSNSNSPNGFNLTGYIYADTSQSPTILYFVDTNGHRLARVRATDGQDFRWVGRNSVSPTGGNPGCSSSAVGATNPGWCTGGTAGRYGNTNATFYNPAGLAVTANKIYVADTVNARVQKFDKTTGVFDGWIGSGSLLASNWSRTIPAGTVAARGGFDDYSFIEYASAAWYSGLTGNGTQLFQSDVGFHRVKKFNLLDGTAQGYVGTISGFGPTGPSECVGYTSGFTPAWCTGGGRTTSGNAVHGYNNPFSLASDNTYVYVGNYSNNRIDRVRITDGTYMGWLGYINTSPTDGESTCAGSATANYTPGWCIGGTAAANTTNLGFSSLRAVYYDAAATHLYVTENSGRLIKLNPSTGAFLGVTGGVTTASVTGCTAASNTAGGWCTTATGNSGNGYGAINAGAGIASNSNYIFVVDMGTSRVSRYEKVTGSPAGFIGQLTNATNLNTAATSFTVNSLTTTNGCYNQTTGYPRSTNGWCLGNTIGSAVTTQTGTGDSMFNSPRGIWADDISVFVADTVNNRLMKFDAVTGVFIGWKGYIADATGMTCLSGTPVKGLVTPDWCKGGLSGPGKTLGAFDFLSGLHGDANYVYVLDTRNNRTVTVPR